MALDRLARWLVVVVGVAVLVAGAMWIFPDGAQPGAAVDLPQGVMPLVIEDVGLIAVRTGDAVVVFRGFDRRAEPLEWCAASNVFTTNRGGSVYDLMGQKLGGPAPSGLDRVSVEPLDGGQFRIDPNRLLDPILVEGATLPPLPASIVSDGWLDRFTGQASYCPSLEEVG